jgi:hypothetical protein
VRNCVGPLKGTRPENWEVLIGKMGVLMGKMGILIGKKGFLMKKWCFWPDKWSKSAFLIEKVDF